MSHPEHDRVSEIFLKACDCAPDARAAFLDESCAGDPELRAEVESLLDHDADAPPILDQGLAGSAFAALEQTPQRVGRYQVLDKIGEGGMGIVYSGRQLEPIRRHVAIKLIKRGFETREVIARFESERQSLALMQHPNIAGVIDAGATEDGRPWFCMEYVDGMPITRYCDENKLDVRHRLELILQVCEGVQHAHQKAIIHRDLKPSNILVAVDSGRPVPKIIDFGIAKALHADLTAGRAATRLGQSMGTPEYMSPEQAAIEPVGVDTRTDVYSLGVVLYELLTGTQPFESLDPQRRPARPRNPSTRVSDGKAARTAAQNRSTETRHLARRLRGDLDTIVLKALELEPARRYPSPLDLAADIRRHLRDEPILATQPTVLYRMRKFARRYRAGVAFAAALLLLLIGFALTMAIQASRIAVERDRAGREAATALQMLGFVEELFKLSDPAAARGNEITAREILEDSVHKIETQLQGQPEVQARLMALTGRVYRNLGLHDEGRRLLAAAHRRQRELLGETHPDTLRSGASLAFLYMYGGEFTLAEPLFDETLARQRETLGVDHPDTLLTMKSLGNLYTASGQSEASEILHLDLLARCVRVLGDEHELTLRTRNDIGILYTEIGRYDDAEAYCTRALSSMRRELGPDHPTTLAAMNSLAVIRMNLERYDDARQLFEEAQERKHRVLGPDHPSTLKTLYNRACLEARSGERRRAIDLLTEAIGRGYASARLHTDRDLSSLRADPAFQALVAGISLPAAGQGDGQD